MSILLLLAALVLPPPALPVPPDGYDLRYGEHLEALARLTARSLVRVEAVHTPPPPYDPDYPVVEDGGGVVVRPGVLLTSARYVTGAGKLRLVRRDGSRVEARVLRSDAEADLALLAFEASAAPELVPAPGFAPLPEPAPYAAPTTVDGENAALEVVMPTSLTGDYPGVRVAAALREGPDLYLSGLAFNGIPAYDRFGRVVALALRVAPDRSRSVGLGGEALLRWLAGP